MKTPDENIDPDRVEFALTPEIRDAAAHWIVRRDRGMTKEESEEFERWCGVDPRHAVALAEAEANWTLLDRFPPESARPARAIRLRGPWLIAAGVAAAVAVVFFRSFETSVVERGGAHVLTIAATDTVRTAVLRDGSQVVLNAGSVLLEGFTTAERTVRLLRGEAHFAVAKNPARPFVVRAGDARVLAVGTAFNVQLNERAVDVLVTEGLVRVEGRALSTAGADDIASTGGQAFSGPVTTLAMLRAGQRAVVLRALKNEAGPLEAAVTTPTAVEIARSLAWQEPLLRLDGATLSHVAKEFERRTGHRIVFADADLAHLRIGGFFQPDDVSGFVHVLESNFGLSAERTGSDETILRRKR